MQLVPSAATEATVVMEVMVVLRLAQLQLGLVATVAMEALVEMEVPVDLRLPQSALLLVVAAEMEALVAMEVLADLHLAQLPVHLGLPLPLDLVATAAMEGPVATEETEVPASLQLALYLETLDLRVHLEALAVLEVLRELELPLDLVETEATAETEVPAALWLVLEMLEALKMPELGLPQPPLLEVPQLELELDLPPCSSLDLPHSSLRGLSQLVQVLDVWSWR